jgi:hypothetical protein
LENYYEENNEKVNNQITSYINAGFFGLIKRQIHFKRFEVSASRQ